jgi:Ca2+-binding RTX toxin-like protein
VTRVLGAEVANDNLLIDGHGGSDRVTVDGTAGADTLSAVANGLVASVIGDPLGNLRVDTADEQLELAGHDGADALSATGNLATITALTFSGGSGGDTLLGSNGADTLTGGGGDDTIDGNQGADLLDGGAGDDTLVWDPGDGSDTVEGGSDTDTLRFNGSNIGELFSASAAGGRVSFTRNIGTITMDLDDVERLDLRALGGADTLTVNDLAGTDLGLVAVDLAAAGGGGDAQLDTVLVNGTGGDDLVSIAAANGGVEASRTGTAVTRVLGAEAANDTLVVEGLEGDDVIDVEAGVEALIQLVLNP